MSPRKPKIDALDDEDDEDGILEEEVAQESDLTLHVADEDEVGLGRVPKGMVHEDMLEDEEDEE